MSTLNNLKTIEKLTLKEKVSILLEDLYSLDKRVSFLKDLDQLNDIQLELLNSLKDLISKLNFFETFALERINGIFPSKLP